MAYARNKGIGIKMPYPPPGVKLIPLTDADLVSDALPTPNGRNDVGVLRDEYPGANIVMPHPSYYNIADTVKLNLPVVNGISYMPMASCTDALQRLCPAGDVKAMCHGEDVARHVSNNVLDLKALCEEGVRCGKKIVFFGEYICDLSYVCLIQGDSVTNRRVRRRVH